MMVGKYSLAGRVVQIESLYETVHKLCADYISEAMPDFCVRITQADIRSEEERSAIQSMREGKKWRSASEEYLETLGVYRKIAEKMVSFNTILMHGSAIAVDGQGYLFTAKSGTGKSTHTRLWREMFEHRAIMINDDKPLLKITEEGVLVCGTPWDGKHRLSSNAEVPLKSICILERGTENEIYPIPPDQAIPRLLEQCYRPEDTAGMLHTLELLDCLSRNVKFYRLYCNMEPDAAHTAFYGMI